MSTPQFQDIPNRRLEELMSFPALIPVKAISHKQADEAQFRATLIELTALHVPGFQSDLVSIRASSAGNYYAATLSVTFANADQFRMLDAALRAHPMVRLVL
ncbi:DUF493 domain-containing protein [Chitiniphilus purpureus]|uniref:DUF493 domain-containing protein n=1 Tax=Chitiniphilus purpureus TaxID=2981137 RepID=A0ABY6DP14_9NEIS|nr:DUF493 domain-containing protein [Chitiniphilus sp. CD1]UXY15413.1 DUF493 domain-containing protein [Chitiniphilus sp. CD1]